jgi:hypothetical protein
LFWYVREALEDPPENETAETLAVLLLLGSVNVLPDRVPEVTV